MADPVPPQDDAQRALTLLLEMRRQGFGCESVRVGDVELVGVRDYDPHPKALLARAESEDRDKRPGYAGAIAEWGGDLLEDGRS